MREKVIKLGKQIKKAKKPILIIGIIVGAICISFVAYNFYNINIPRASENNSLYNYYPFKERRVVTLDEPSTLSFTDDMPSIDCATALYPLVAAFVEATYPNGDYSPNGWWSEDSESRVLCTQTAGAYEALINGYADIIFVAAPSKEQMIEAQKMGVELKLTPIGKEAFIFFNNVRNPVKGLTIEQIQDIYSGSITNWNELGGKSEEIRAFQRKENSGSQTALINIMGNKPLISAPKEDVMDIMAGMVEVVADYKNYKNAIGFSFRYYSTQMVGDSQIQLLEINGVYPDKDTIRDESYPFASNFYAVTAGTDNPHVGELIQWILSPQGQELIEKTGYVGLD